MQTSDSPESGNDKSSGRNNLIQSPKQQFESADLLVLRFIYKDDLLVKNVEPQRKR